MREVKDLCLIEELKHSDVDKEYDILNPTIDIMNNFEDKVKAINDMKKDVLKEELEETSPYTDIKSNGIYSLNTGWVKHPVQQDIPDIDMDEFEKEFKVWEDKYFDLLDEFKKHKLQDEKWIRDNVTTGQISLGESINSKTNVEAIDNLIEDIYNLRKEGMEEEGEYSIKNLIFKEFRNLGYLDNLKELRKKQISKELSLESLKEELVNYSNEDEVNYKTKEIMDVISQQFEDPLDPLSPEIYTTLGYISYVRMVEGCDYKDLVKLVVPYILFNNTKYSVYYTDKWGWDGSDYIITKKDATLKDLYMVFKWNWGDWGELEDPLSKKEFEDHVFTVDKDANYINVRLD